MITSMRKTRPTIGTVKSHYRSFSSATFFSLAPQTIGLPRFRTLSKAMARPLQ